MSRTVACAAGAAALALVLAGCAGLGCPYPQPLLFSELPSDSVYLACPDGTLAMPLMTATPARTFYEAAGTSLLAPIAVVVQSRAPSQPSNTDQPELYDLQTGQFAKFSGLTTTGSGAWLALSPDGRSLAFEYFRVEGPGALGGLWIADLSTGSAQPLVDLPSGIQMTALRWRPDGREILAVQLDFQSAVPTVSLVAVDYPSGEIRTLFGPSVGVLGAAFGPDGKEFAIWSVRGLEIVREDTLQRTLVLPLSRLGGRELGIQGLQWSAADNLIALVLRAPVTGQSQLWVVRPDGTDPREIYPAPNGQQLLLGSFIAGPWSAARPYPGS